MALRRIPIHRSLHRYNLFCGAERELCLMTGLLTFTCVFVAMSIPVAVIGIVAWFVIIGLLRQMAKADPIMSKVYLRHRRYQALYQARSTPWILER
jgi:type IV secretion system protein VirB3